MSTVRFLRSNRFRKEIGQLDSQMPYGVHDALVMRGIAEWVDKSPITVASISDPVAESKPETPVREKRRHFSKETT